MKIRSLGLEVNGSVPGKLCNFMDVFLLMESDDTKTYINCKKGQFIQCT
jgi:3-deoxy-D-manno-octulosonic acid (KDO) 8-phosphate synthase